MGPPHYPIMQVPLSPLSRLMYTQDALISSVKQGSLSPAVQRSVITLVHAGFALPWHSLSAPLPFATRSPLHRGLGWGSAAQSLLTRGVLTPPYAAVPVPGVPPAPFNPRLEGVPVRGARPAPSHRGPGTPPHTGPPRTPPRGGSPLTAPQPAPDLDEQLDVEQRVAGSGEPGAQHHEQALSALSALGPARPRPRPGAAARGRQRLQGQRRRVRHGPATTAPGPRVQLPERGGRRGRARAGPWRERRRGRGRDHGRGGGRQRGGGSAAARQRRAAAGAVGAA